MLRTSNRANGEASLRLNPASPTVKGPAISVMSEICEPFTLKEFQHLNAGDFAAMQIEGRGGVGGGPAPSQHPPWPPAPLTLCRNETTQGPRVPAVSIQLCLRGNSSQGDSGTPHAPCPQSPACVYKRTSYNHLRKRGHPKVPESKFRLMRKSELLRSGFGVFSESLLRHRCPLLMMRFKDNTFRSMKKERFFGNLNPPPPRTLAWLEAALLM